MAFKEAYTQTLIDDESVFLDMIEQRNLSSHIYDEYEISDILYRKLSEYVSEDNTYYRIIGSKIEYIDREHIENDGIRYSSLYELNKVWDEAEGNPY